MLVVFLYFLDSAFTFTGISYRMLLAFYQNLQIAIDHYHEELDGLLSAGIEPMVTLLHFTHPLWLEDKGGFENDAAPAAFVAFARRMYTEYGGKVTISGLGG